MWRVLQASAGSWVVWDTHQLEKPPAPFLTPADEERPGEHRCFLSPCRGVGWAGVASRTTVISAGRVS